MLKNDKFKKYFDNMALNFYHKKQRADNNYLKYVAGKIHASAIYCKSEYKKAQIKFYHKVSRVKNISVNTGISIENLIELVYLGDLKLNKPGIDSFTHIFTAVKQSSPLTPVIIADKQVDNVKNKPESLNISLDNFLIHLSKQLETIRNSRPARRSY